MLDGEFARLAVARALVSGGRAAGTSLADDRRNAEQWISRFGGASSSGREANPRTRSGSVVVRPTRQGTDDTDDTWVVYVHGGGMVHYSTAVFEPFLQVLADALGAPVEAFDYDKAPECPVSRSIDDLAERVASRCRELDGRRLVLAGDSVGGLLALYLGLRVLPGVFSQVVLIYPVLDLRTERESYATFGEGFFLDRDRMRVFASLVEPALRARDLDPMHLSAADVARLPPVLVVTAGCDVLRDEAFAWVAAVQGRGADVRHQVFPDLPHDFCLYAPRLGSARRAVESFAQSITARAALGGGARGTTQERTT